MTQPDSDSNPAPDWPAFLPHREIDRLLERLEHAAVVDPAEAARLLRLVTKEVQRLRSMTLRLTTEKLAEADREARGIVSEALGHADSLRHAGLTVLSSRLDEADRLMATVREAYRVELRAAGLADLGVPDRAEP
ncbi:hypothetical protein GUY44_17115 [Pimelobacter simplex]|uniref:Uncharacterized protein n=1 Tax=Nocardioides simplex TaxID=2045 RepID=A0A0A1DI56_NOCSI|nr:hypothetical protein [Pimelobacter simplex]AIY17021.1 hypothetical protein KR76_10120 [Pimelobacter simplex]MCG8152213.1 hypothetical protein [Pimelobacter simplex]GEB12956.1 hypothetical protein NSI01_12710 [Pimelobacter simplex]SFM51672.1 hypothetical protein SAMN05421671_2074 [Pimelobacter simplex]